MEAAGPDDRLKQRIEVLDAEGPCGTDWSVTYN